MKVDPGIPSFSMKMKDVYAVTLTNNRTKLPEKNGEHETNEPHQLIGCTYQLLGLPS